MGFLEGIGNLMGGNKQEKPQVLDSHEEVNTQVELDAVNKRIAELNMVEDSDDVREELRKLHARKENLGNPVRDWSKN